MALRLILLGLVGDVDGVTTDQFANRFAGGRDHHERTVAVIAAELDDGMETAAENILHVADGGEVDQTVADGAPRVIHVAVDVDARHFVGGGVEAVGHGPVGEVAVNVFLVVVDNLVVIVVDIVHVRVGVQAGGAGNSG